MNIKRIIKEELDGLQWIKDVKSNQDIAQEIADETKIKNGRLYPPFSLLFTPTPTQFTFLSRSAFASLIFRNYGKEQYGLDKEDANDVWKRYKDIIKDKINDHSNINESNDLQWIKDIKPTLNDAFEQGTLKVGDVLTLSGDLADCDAKTTKEVNDFKIKIVKLKGNINNSYFIPLQKKYWEHLEYEGKGNTRFYRSDGKMRIEDQHNEL